MNKLNEAQVDGLIDLVKEKPALFNTADKYHKNFAMKEMIWKEISVILGADERDCKTAWKSLRDQFVKAAREERNCVGQEPKLRKTYKYFNKLLFLRESLHNRTTPNNEYMEGPMTMDFDVSTTSTPNNLLCPGPSKRRRAPETDDWLKEMLSEIMSEVKKANAKPPQEENDAFFMNLASMVNRAQLAPCEARLMQRRVFNFVADELDRIDRNK